MSCKAALLSLELEITGGHVGYITLEIYGGIDTFLDSV